MILINLLPPELRKRQGGVSPMFLSVVAGGGSCVLLLLLWLYVLLVRIPNADRVLAGKEAELADKTVLAAAVLTVESKISEAKDRYEQIVGMMNRKVYWARTIDEFATLLNGPFTAQNFDVRCLDLTISESSALPGNRRGATEAASVAFNVNWKYKLLGKEFIRNGDYIKSFFDTIGKSKFWVEHGFAGKPEESYLGDQPRMRKEIQRVVIEGNLEWQRVKTVVDPKVRK